jgi:hypothetical protein
MSKSAGPLRSLYEPVLCTGRYQHRRTEEMTTMATTALPIHWKVLHSEGTWRHVCAGGATAWLAGTVAIEGYAALGRALGLSMMAGFPGAHAAQHITGASFATGVFVGAFWGTLFAVLLLRFASHPARAFVLIAVVVLVVSLVTPLAASHTAESMRLFLAGGHVLVAAILIPLLARQLPGRSQAA